MVPSSYSWKRLCRVPVAAEFAALALLASCGRVKDEGRGGTGAGGSSYRDAATTEESGTVDAQGDAATTRETGAVDAQGDASSRSDAPPDGGDDGASYPVACTDASTGPLDAGFIPAADGSADCSCSPEAPCPLACPPGATDNCNDGLRNLDNVEWTCPRSSPFAADAGRTRAFLRGGEYVFVYHEGSHPSQTASYWYALCSGELLAVIDRNGLYYNPQACRGVVPEGFGPELPGDECDACEGCSLSDAVAYWRDGDLGLP